MWKKIINLITLIVLFLDKCFPICVCSVFSMQFQMQTINHTIFPLKTPIGSYKNVRIVQDMNRFMYREFSRSVYPLKQAAARYGYCKPQHIKLLKCTKHGGINQLSRSLNSAITAPAVLHTAQTDVANILTPALRKLAGSKKLFCRLKFNLCIL